LRKERKEVDASRNVFYYDCVHYYLLAIEEEIKRRVTAKGILGFFRRLINNKYY